MRALKIGALAVAAVVVAGVVGMQLLGLTNRIPDGPRLWVMAQYYGVAALGIGLLALLFLIPKANRNLPAFLKAFVVLGALSCLGNCSSWMNKFRGPEKRIAGDSGVSVAVPSDWEATAHPERADLMVMDWAGTASVTVTIAGPADPDVTTAQVEETLTAFEEQASGLVGKPVGSFGCGAFCLGREYDVERNGRTLHVLLAAKSINGHWLFIHGTLVGASRVKQSPRVVAVIASAAVSPSPAGAPAAAR
jgi:hypothetical protein